MAEPRNDEERAILNSRLRKKYPKMFEKSWVNRLKKHAKAELKSRKRKMKPLEKVVDHRKGEDESLRGALSADEIRRLRGS